MTDIEKRLRRVVAGQVRSYINDHPEMFVGKKKHWKRAVIDGITKRAVPDVLSVVIPADRAADVAARTAPPVQVPAAVGATAAAGQLSFLARHWRAFNRWRA